MSSKYLITTNLEAVLLNAGNECFESAKPALLRCKQDNVPVILNTNKTHVETLLWRDKLSNEHPYIIENGSAVIIPNGYFPSEYLISQGCGEYQQQYSLCLGQPRPSLLAKLTALRINHHYDFLGFNDLNVEQICQYTGQTLHTAELSRARHYSEPILWLDSDAKFSEFKEHLTLQGLTLKTQGCFHHIVGQTNKASAILWLKNIYQHYHQQEVVIIALGNGIDDLTLLETADVAVVVNSSNQASKAINHDNVIYTELAGSSGWNQAVLDIIE